jgi:hypothetical protein
MHLAQMRENKLGNQGSRLLLPLKLRFLNSQAIICRLNRTVNYIVKKMMRRKLKSLTCSDLTLSGNTCHTSATVGDDLNTQAQNLISPEARALS